MNEPKYTEGEWRYSPLFGEVTTSPLGIIEGSKSICRNIRYVHKRNDESDANGYLIAAAKELLEACKSMADAWECYLRNPDNIGVDIEAEIDNARMAIAKAKGE